MKLVTTDASQAWPHRRVNPRINIPSIATTASTATSLNHHSSITITRRSHSFGALNISWHAVSNFLFRSVRVLETIIFSSKTFPQLASLQEQWLLVPEHKRSTPKAKRLLEETGRSSPRLDTTDLRRLQRERAG